MHEECNQIRLLWKKTVEELDEAIGGFDLHGTRRMRKRSILRIIIPKSITNNIQTRIIPMLISLNNAYGGDFNHLNAMEDEMLLILRSLESVQLKQMELLRGKGSEEAILSKEYSLSIEMKSLLSSCREWASNFDDLIDVMQSQEEESEPIQRPGLFSYIEARKTRDSIYLTNQMSESVEVYSEEEYEEEYRGELSGGSSNANSLKPEQEPPKRKLSDALEETMRGFELIMTSSEERLDIENDMAASNVHSKDLPPTPPAKDQTHSKKFLLPRLITNHKLANQLPFSPIPFITSQYRLDQRASDETSNRSSRETMTTSAPRDSLHKKSKALKSELKYLMQYDDFLDAYEEDVTPSISRQNSHSGIPPSQLPRKEKDHLESTPYLPFYIPKDLKKAKRVIKSIVNSNISKFRKNWTLREHEPPEVMEISRPTNVQHLGHIGKTKSGELVSSNVPPSLMRSSIFIKS